MKSVNRIRFHGALKIRLARKMHADKSVEIGDICSALNISKATLYRYLRT